MNWIQPAVLVVALSAPVAWADQLLMPPAQQTALVMKYCAVCHTDAARNGGLSLQHFDAASAPPSLAAMLLSKLTGGVSLDVVRQVRTSAAASTLVGQTMKNGAMGAAGLPIPDKPVIEDLIYALAMKSAGAADWAVERSGKTTASILQEVPSTTNPSTAEAYRLIVSCNSATREGSMQLAWSPVAQSGSLTASVDGGKNVTFRVEGSEKMGNGSALVLHGLAAVQLAGLPLPSRSLTIRDLFPGHVVAFSFTSLPPDDRKDLSACFLADLAADSRKTLR